MEPGEDFTLLYWDEDRDAEYEINLEDVVEGAGLTYGGFYSVIEISVEAGEFVFEVEVQLNEPWNLISINVIPPEDMWENELGPDLELMTEQLRIDEDNHHLILMKNSEGQFYSPADNFNNIPYWDLEEGYLIKVDEDVMAVWSGRRIVAGTDINLEAGWNMIAYYPTYELDASDPDFYVLSPIIDQVEIAKDGDGNFMIPEFEFSNMPPWRESQGYHVKLDEDVVLNYPEQEDQDEDDVFQAVEKFETTLTPTGSNMSLLILGLQSSSGSLLRAIDHNNALVGQGVIDSDGRCGLAIWGDDESTDVKDGLADGEAFTLMLGENVLTPSAYLTGKSLTYETDGFIVIEHTIQARLPAEYYLSEAYPNPFNNKTVINFGLPESGRVKIDLFDISGRRIKSLGEFEKSAGIHSFELNATGLSSGLFLVGIEVNGFNSVKKIVLMK